MQTSAFREGEGVDRSLPVEFLNSRDDGGFVVVLPQHFLHLNLKILPSASTRCNQNVNSLTTFYTGFMQASAATGVVLPDIVLQKKRQLLLIGLDGFRMPVENESPLTHQEMWEIPALSHHEGFTMQADHVIQSRQPWRVPLVKNPSGIILREEIESNILHPRWSPNTSKGESSSGFARDSFVSMKGNIFSRGAK